MSSTVFYNYSLLCSRHSVILYLLPSTRFLQAVQGFFSHHPIFHPDALSDLRYLPHKYFRLQSLWFLALRSSTDNFCRNIFSRFSNCRIFFFPSSISAVNSSRVFSLGFVMAGRSFLLIGTKKDSRFLGCPLWVAYLVLLCATPR